MFRRGAEMYPLKKGLIDGVILGYRMAESDKDAVVAAARVIGIDVYQASPELYQYGMEIKPL